MFVLHRRLIVYGVMVAVELWKHQRKAVEYKFKLCLAVRCRKASAGQLSLDDFNTSMLIK